MRLPTFIQWQFKMTGLIICCVLILMAGFYFYIQPTWTNFEKIHAQIKITEQTWLQLQNKTRHQKIKNISNQSLENAITSDNLLAKATLLAQQTGVTLLTLHPSEKHLRKKIVVERLSLTGQGNFHQMVHFYQALLHLPYCLTLPNWQLSVSTYPSLNLRLMIEVYHLSA